MFKRALISTDFKDSLYRIACVIPSLAESGITDITFFHNVAVQTDRSVPKIDEEGMKDARQRFEEIIGDQVPAGVHVKVDITSGRPSDNILRQVESTDCEILFLGTPTRNVLSEKLFGSTTIKLIERTSVPMMILRPQLVATYTTEELGIRCRNLFHRLLIPYDGSQGSKDFLETLKAQIQKSPPPDSNQYWLLWVIDENIRRELQGDRPIEEARKQLHQAADTLRELDLNVETLVEEGNPLEEILRIADRYDIGAIATSSRGIGGFLRWSVPSLTREILRQSWHPVLYFPK